jgi:hypothetical protein
MHRKFKTFVSTESPTFEKSRSGYQREAIGEEIETDTLCSFLSMAGQEPKATSKWTYKSAVSAYDIESVLADGCGCGRQFQSRVSRL